MSDGCWWTARVTRFNEPSRNGLVWVPRMGPALAAALGKVPVRCYRVGRRLLHPPAARDRDPLALDLLVGLVDHARADRYGVWATLRLADDVPVPRRALLAMERDGVLARTIGVSLVAQLDTVPRELMTGRAVRVVTRIRGVLALDLVTDPAGAGAAVLRSIAAPIHHHEGVLA